MTPKNRASAVLTLAVLAGTLSACSDDDGGAVAGPAASPSAAATTAPAPTASPSPAPEVPLTSARAMAVARSIVLRATDVPVYRKVEDGDTDASPSGPDEDDPFDTCLKDASSPLLASFASPTFGTGTSDRGFGVSSSTDVVARAAEARRDFAALTRPSLLPCLNKALATSFAEDPDTAGVSVSGSFVRVPTSKPAGADSAARFSYAGTIAAPGVRFDFAVGLTALVVGRAEVTLEETNLGGVPGGLAGRDRDTLVGVLVRRAQSAQHLGGL